MADDAGKTFCEHLDFVYRVALAATGDPVEAQDVVQDSFLRFISGRQPDSGLRSPKGYLAQVVAHAATNRARGEHRRRAREDSRAREEAVSAPGTLSTSAEELTALRAAVAALPAGERLAVSLHFLEGLTIEEAAAALAVPRSTASDRVQKGLDLLRKALAASGLGAIAIPTALDALPKIAAPVALKAAVSRLAMTGTGAAASAAAAAKGGIAMKVIVGIVLAGAVAAGVAVVSGGSGDTPLPAEKSKKKFSTPIWHPDARWESAEPWTGGGNACPSQLDGPRREIMYYAVATGFAEGGRFVYYGYDASSERIHTLAFSGCGLLDGPFSRARYGGCGYLCSVGGPKSADGRYSVFIDRRNGSRLRMMDFKEQMVSTIKLDRPWPGTQAMVLDSKGQVWLYNRGRLLIVDLSTSKTVRDFTLKAKKGIDLGGGSITLDEKKNRLYVGGCVRFNKGRPGAPGGDPKRWHVWYFDLNDGGSVHPVLSGDMAGPNPGYAGPFDTYKGYGECSVYFGPDDPEKRFLYMRVTDTSTFMRLDLEKRMVAACSGPPRGKNGPVMFIESGVPNKTVSHVGPRWLPGGDFIMPGVLGRPNKMYRRVK